MGAVLVVVLGLAMLSQGGSISGWLSPDLLLVLVIALCVAGIVLSIPFETKALRHVLQAASLLLVVGAGLAWSFQGTLLKSKTSSQNSTQIVDGAQVVTSTLSSGSYPNITVQSGVPVKWVIDAPQGSINGCNNRVLIRDYGIEYTFHEGENVIEFTPQNAGTVPYTC